MNDIKKTCIKQWTLRHRSPPVGLPEPVPLYSEVPVWTDPILRESLSAGPSVFVSFLHFLSLGEL